MALARTVRSWLLLLALLSPLPSAPAELSAEQADLVRAQGRNIRARVMEHWAPLAQQASSGQGFSDNCGVYLELTDMGALRSVDVSNCRQNAVLCQITLAAIALALPIPMIDDPQLLPYFERIYLGFGGD